MRFSGFSRNKGRLNISKLSPLSTVVELPVHEHYRPHRKITPLLILLSLLACCFKPGALRAESGYSISNWFEDWNSSQYYLYSSLYTKHFDPDPDHVNNQNMLGFESQTRDKRVLGLAIFDNSFGQESQYLYTGKKWRQFDSDHWHLKLTGGFIHGYKEPYEDKIPLNGLGVAPAIVPGISYENKRLSVEYAQLGLAAGMVLVGFTF